MRYSTGQTIMVGDHVKVDGMAGIVVCDFDNRAFVAGYGGWDSPDAEMIGGGTLSSGIMVNTTEAGLIHYEQGSAHILFVEASGLQPPGAKLRSED
jgi:hypothetical protein